MLNQAFIVFSGYNDRAIISFMRFAEKENVDVYIVASSVYDKIFLTKYRKHIKYIRSNIIFEYNKIIKILIKIKIKYKKDRLVVLPSTEYVNRSILKNKKLFEDNDIYIPLVDYEIYENVSDKFSFRNIVSLKSNIKVPKLYSYDNAKVPFVVKPKRYFDDKEAVQFKPLLITNQEHYQSFRSKDCFNDYFIEEYVEGKSYYLLYYFPERGDPICYSQENLVQQPGGGSICAARAARYHDESINSDYITLLQNIGFHGLIMIEVRISKDDSYMIEANPRLWGPSQLFLDSNIPIFHHFVADLGFHLTWNEQITGDKYFWSGGMLTSNNAQSPIYHGTSRNEFYDQFYEFLQSDIYLRPDTLSLFHQEIRDSNAH